jgi:hypothetical protein
MKKHSLARFSIYPTRLDELTVLVGSYPLSPHERHALASALPCMMV